MPLTPPQVIPTFDETRKRKRGASKSERKSPKNNGREELLIDFSTPASNHAAPPASGAETLHDPFGFMEDATLSASAMTAVRTAGDQEAVSREEDAEELRKVKKQAILDQRAVRRKSMANRRVSFAPEATLHTWNVIETVDDSTTSSTSNSTKRQSSITATQAANESEHDPVPVAEQIELPSTPPEQVSEPLVEASPAHQRDLHQRRRRRSSGVSRTPPRGVAAGEVSPASSHSGSSAMENSSPIHVEDSMHSSSDDDGDTAMSMDDATDQTLQSGTSSSSTGSSLDERLRRAAAEAGTRGIEYDEKSDDLSMELAEGTITSAFQPWVKRDFEIPAQDRSTVQGCENTKNDEKGDDCPMELAEGTITSAFQPWVNSDLPTPAQDASVIQREESNDNENNENSSDLTMEFADSTITHAFQSWVQGGPQVSTQDGTNQEQDPKQFNDNEDSEDLSMELAENTITKAFQSWIHPAALVPAQQKSAIQDQDQQNISSHENTDNIPMELAECTTTKAFQSWVHKKPQVPTRGNSTIQDQEKENINHSSAAVISRANASELDTAVKVVEDSVVEEHQEQVMEKISLQDFLNMTNIHFMELSTTKRRHTLAPVAPARLSQEGSSISSGACFAAAATTLPLLELYQHATRELKSYISTGRNVIRTMERETLEEQPTLFREYVDARPDVKMVMDNQFRNGKANARLQSKQGWYAWRRQLVEGLRGGLDGIKAGLEKDAASLMRQEEMLQDTIPDLVKQLGGLEKEAQMLQQRAENYESTDHESVRKARGQLESADRDVAEKMLLLGQLQQQMADKAEALSAADELKVEFQEQIAEAERVQDECRGWKAEDVKILKEQVTKMEKRAGWTLVTAEHEVEEGDVDFGPALTMRYRNALRLFFYPAAFQPSPSEQDGRRRSRRSKSNSGPSAPISLTYAPIEAEAAPSTSLTTHQRFFLQILQGHLHALAILPTGSTSTKTLLNLVSQGWDLSVNVSEEIRLLEIAGITNVSIVNDAKLGVKCILMLPDRGRIDVHFKLTANATMEGRLSTSVVVEAMPRYGSITTLLTGAKACKVEEALNKQATSKRLGAGAWVAAIRGLEEWVKLQRKETSKGPPSVKTPAIQPAPAPAPGPAPVSIASQVDTPTPAPTIAKKELRKPVPMDEVMEEAAARQEEQLRRQEEEVMLMSASKTPAAYGRRPGALRRSP